SSRGRREGGRGPATSRHCAPSTTTASPARSRRGCTSGGSCAGAGATSRRTRTRTSSGGPGRRAERSGFREGEHLEAGGDPLLLDEAQHHVDGRRVVLA